MATTPAPLAIAALRECLFDGLAIPAHPLALDSSRRLDRRRQRALARYYLDAGAGGLAVGVHTTQFAIREAGLFEEVLTIAAETARDWPRFGRLGAAPRPLLVAGACGRTQQARAEARLARGLGYDAALLSLAAWKSASEEEIVDHCAAVAQELPLIGFYLQPAVGGLDLPASFWARFAGLDNVVAIKVAPFNRYRTLDVVRGVIAARAEDRVALYTGNDDHIVLDLITPFRADRDGRPVTVRFRGGPARSLVGVDERRGRSARALQGERGGAGRRRGEGRRSRAARARQPRHRLQQRLLRRRERLPRLHRRLPRGAAPARSARRHVVPRSR
jgi:dihydrodipicolinate synthase/N-acetylneuraminate lyase